MAQQQATATVNGQVFRLTLLPGWDREPRREDFDSAYLRIGSPDGIDEGAIYLQVFPKGRFTEETYQRAVRRYITERMDGTLLAESTPTIDGKKAWRVEYEGVSVGYVGSRRHFLNTVFFVGEQIVVVHCAAQSDRWDEFRENFIATSDSFEAADN